VGGFVAPRLLEGGCTIGYDLKDLSTGATCPLARQSPPGLAVGRYYLDPAAIGAAQDIIDRAVAGCDVAIVDEVGPLEMAGGGHATAVRRLSEWHGTAVLTVRPALTEAVAAKYALRAYLMVRLSVV
jgi:nucleoside-triphosphatase THEP1